MTKYHGKFRKIPKSIWAAVAFLLVFSFLLHNVTGSAYYSLLMKPSISVSSPPVKLQEGTAANSTKIIYTNSTSAKVSVIGQGDFNYVLNFTEKEGYNWKVRLSAYDQSNINRLTNCSIYIYDATNSTQIVILNGNYSVQTGSWYDLEASDTEYIWIHVNASTGTSFIYAYLEILVPGTTTYARYIITFEIM